mgnify:CR=1 FL=1
MRSDNTTARHAATCETRGLAALRPPGMSDKTCSLTFRSRRSAEGFLNQCFRPAPEGSDASRFIIPDSVRGHDCGLTVSYLCECLSEGGNGKAARTDRLGSMVDSGSEALEGILQRAVHEVGVDLGGRQVPVTEGPLDNQNVPGPTVEVGGEGVPKPMRAELLVDPRGLEPILEPPGHLALAEPFPVVGEEHGSAFSVALASAFDQVTPQEGAQGGL